MIDEYTFFTEILHREIESREQLQSADYQECLYDDYDCSDVLELHYE